MLNNRLMSSFEEYYFKNIGKKIRYYRLKIGYTQEELSELLGMNDKYIGHVERYERCISNKVLIRLLEVFKVQPKDFFQFDDDFNFKV